MNNELEIFLEFYTNFERFNMFIKNRPINKIIIILSMISNQAFSYFDYKPDYFKYINFPELFHVKNENIIVTFIY